MRRSIEMLGWGSSRTFSSRTLRYAPVIDGGSVCSSSAMCVALGCLSARTLSNNRRARTVCACSRLTVCVFRLANVSLLRPGIPEYLTGKPRPLADALGLRDSQKRLSAALVAQRLALGLGVLVGLGQLALRA